jgi:transcription elongation factor Elf1
VFRYKHKEFYRDGKRHINGSALYDPALNVVLPEHLSPAIVSQEDFDAVQAILYRNRKGKEKKRIKNETFLLRRMIRCGVCGRFFTPITSRNHRAYVCTSKQNPSVNCGTKSVKSDLIEEKVWELVAFYATHPEVLEQKISEAQRSESVSQEDIEREVDKLTKNILRLNGEIRNLVARAENVDEETWKLFEERIAAKRSEIGRLETIRTEHLARRPKGSNSKAFGKIAEKYREKIISGDLTLDDRIAVLKSFNLSISWDGEDAKASIHTQYDCKSNPNGFDSSTVISLKIEV